MAQADGQIIIQVNLDDKDAQKGLKGIDKEVDTLEKSGSSKFSKLGGAVKGLAGAAAIAAGAVVGIGAAVVALSKPLVDAAGAAQALNSQFSQVFGDLEDQATASMNKIAKETSILPERLKGSFVQMAAFAKTTGMDTAAALSLTERATLAAADSAAFYDRSITEVTENLQSFLKGNYENDAALGISATETTRNAKANELYGKSFAKLSEEQKQLTLLAMVEDGNKLSGALGQASREGDGLENVMGNLRQAWENFQVALGTPLLGFAIDMLKSMSGIINNLDLTPVAVATEKAIGAIRTAIEFIVPFVKESFYTLKSFWDGNGTSIIESVQNAFTTVLGIYQAIFNAVVPFVQEQLAIIRQFWEENGAQITQAVQNAFETIKAIIDFLMPAIKLVIDMIWGAIKDVITGTLDVIMGAIKVFSGLFTGDFSKMWEGIKQIFTGAIDLIMGVMTLSFVGGLRTIFMNLSKTLINLVKTKWTTIVNTFKSFGTNTVNTVSNMVTSIINFFKNLFQQGLKYVDDLNVRATDALQKMARNMVDAIKGLPSQFLGYGKSIIEGFVNGLKSLNPLNVISSMVEGIKEKISGAFQINSPSKWMRDDIVGSLAEGADVGVIKYKGNFANAGESMAQFMKNAINPFRDAAMNLSGINAPSASSINNSTVSNHTDQSRKMEVVNHFYGQDQNLEAERQMRRLQFGFGS